MMLGYVLGFPLTAFFATHKLYRRAAEQKVAVSTLKGHQTWGLFYSSFRADVWWWEGTVALRKITIAMIGVFGSNMGQMQVHLTLMLVVLVIVLTATVRPFSNSAQQQRLLQSLELLSLMCIFLTLWGASVFAVYPKCEDAQALGQTIAWCDVLSVFVGVTDFVVLFGLVGCFVAVKLFGIKFKTVIAESRVGQTLSRFSSVRSFRRKHQRDNQTEGKSSASEGTSGEDDDVVGPDEADSGTISDGGTVSDGSCNIEMTRAVAGKTPLQEGEKKVEKEGAAASAGWTTTTDPSTGKPYMYNVDTGETKWVETGEVEGGNATVQSRINPLVHDGNEGAACKDTAWQYVFDENTERHYWYNAETKETQWA